ncbi:MAG: tRNA (adenosine(37)-N6)-threonylcarbamoyltransferase complex ATPase subunit type 1 TsaE [Chloroflexota bacterium]|nr:MAG: tRNA (adenosine(37)-N6)-threonylcarbamoyltransferase complex ATPase subunit type 1 TsaE [Chloroflexota bacterium]
MRPRTASSRRIPAELRPSSADETRRLGEAVGHAAEPGDIVALIGPLGSGKTTFAEGMARAIGVRTWRGSPSFPLMQDYGRETHARVPFLHADLYRLTDPTSVHDLGLEDYLRGEYAVAIEWPESAIALLPADRLTLTFAIDGDARRIRVSAAGPRGRALARVLAA